MPRSPCMPQIHEGDGRFHGHSATLRWNSDRPAFHSDAAHGSVEVTSGANAQLAPPDRQR